MRLLILLLLCSTPALAETTFNEIPDAPLYIGILTQETSSVEMEESQSGGGGGSSYAWPAVNQSVNTTVNESTTPRPRPTGGPQQRLPPSECEGDACLPVYEPEDLVVGSTMHVRDSSPVWPYLFFLPGAAALYFLFRRLRLRRAMFDVSDGRLYLVLNHDRLALMFKAVKRRPVLCVVTSSSQIYNGASRIVLSEKGRAAIHPSDVEELREKLAGFLQKHDTGVVVLEGIDKIAIGTNFNTMHHLLQVLSDGLQGTGRLILVKYATEYFDEKKDEKLRKEFSIMR